MSEGADQDQQGGTWLDTVLTALPYIREAVAGETVHRINTCAGRIPADPPAISVIVTTREAVEAVARRLGFAHARYEIDNDECHGITWSSTATSVFMGASTTIYAEGEITEYVTLVDLGERLCAHDVGGDPPDAAV